MPARNIYHDAVVHALIADGWTITDDPLRLTFGDRDLYVDLGAEQSTIGAEREGLKIAVEVRSFLALSPIRDLEEAVGQYVTYRSILSETGSDRLLYLAVPERVHEGILGERFGRAIVNRLQLRVMVFSEEEERIVKWIE